MAEAVIYVGIDPGLSGAVAFLPEAVSTDMPVIALSKTGFVKNAVDVYGLATLLLLRPGAIGPVKVFLERVHAFPGQGSSSMFSLGMSFWGAAGVVAALGLELVLVEPRAWKAHFKLNADKELARALAQRLYPGVELSRKKDHGRAEALLIARYGMETHK